MSKKRIIYLSSLLIITLLIYYYFHYINQAYYNLESLFLNGDPFSLLISSIALLVSIIALIYTIRTFWLKAGEKFRFTYTTVSSSKNTDDKYIKSITLENLKDKAVVVFAIYFKVGNNNYILLEEFDEEPLIIKPFEVFSKTYDPILFYSFNETRIKIDHLLADKSLSHSLVLSTTNGKYEVQSYVNKWSIHKELFGNLLTNLARPRRLVYKGKAYGKNVEYIADISYQNGNEQVLPINKDSHKYITYEKLNLTEECLKNKERLEDHLRSETHEDLNISSVKVIEWRKEAEDYRELKKDNFYKAENHNKFIYNIFGPIYTWYRDFLRKRKNKRNNT